MAVVSIVTRELALLCDRGVCSINWGEGATRRRAPYVGYAAGRQSEHTEHATDYAAFVKGRQIDAACAYTERGSARVEHSRDVNWYIFVSQEVGKEQ